MIALMLFNRDKYKWEVWSVSLYEEVSYSARYLLGKLSDFGKAKYTHIIDIPISSYEVKVVDGITSYSVIVADEEKLPKVPTLEESIEEQKVKLMGYLNDKI